jgi:hypothetical protein
MKINYTFLKFIFLTGLISLIFFESGAAEVRRSSVSTEHALAYIAFSENQDEKENNAEKAGDNVDNLKSEESTSKASDNNIFYADEWIKSWFVRLDQNGDKVVSKDEFRQNMELFSIENKHLTVFESKEINADGVLNLIEFQSFIDSTNFLSKDEINQKEATITEDADDIDIIKLMAGVLAISLLMAAFKFV